LQSFESKGVNNDELLTFEVAFIFGEEVNDAMKVRLFVFLTEDLLTIECSDELKLVLGAKKFIFEFLKQVKLIPWIHDRHFYSFKMRLKLLQELFVGVLALIAFENYDGVFQVFEYVFEPVFTIFNLVNLFEDVHVIRLVEVKEHKYQGQDNAEVGQEGDYILDERCVFLIKNLFDEQDIDDG